jgi:hypothetical protein
MNLKEAQKRAAELNISGRSKMNKDALLEAIANVEAFETPALPEPSEAEYPIMIGRTDPAPMSIVKRELTYQAQNGSSRLTSRQERRILHKTIRAHGRYVAGLAPFPAL